jgi:hypothetical protein
MANEQNLKYPIKQTKEQAKKNGKKGGIKSGQVRREKKRISQIYGELLQKKHKIKIDDKDVEVTGQQLLEAVAIKVLKRGDAASVSMAKELREATEGNKLALTGGDDPISGIEISFGDAKTENKPAKKA